MEGALKGLADGLDPDSAYLSAKQVTDARSGSRQPDGDVGLEMTRQYYLRVISARDGSPAAQGRTADRRLRARHRRQAHPRHVRVRRQPAPARSARFEGGADDHPRQRRGSARECRSSVKSRPARRVGPPGPARSRRRPSGPSSRRRPVTSASRASATGWSRNSKKQIADLSKTGAKSLVIDVRGDGGRAARERHRRGAPVRQDRHAVDSRRRAAARTRRRS